MTAIAAGSRHTVALLPDGTVRAVGADSHGQCEVQDWRNIIAIAAGSLHTLGLREDGTVVAVGSNAHGQCDVEEWRDVRTPR